MLGPWHCTCWGGGWQEKGWGWEKLVKGRGKELRCGPQLGANHKYQACGEYGIVGGLLRRTCWKGFDFASAQKVSILQIQNCFNQGWKILIKNGSWGRHIITGNPLFYLLIYVAWLVFQMPPVADCNESVEGGCTALVRACKWGRGLLWMNPRLQTDVTLTRTPILFNRLPLRFGSSSSSIFGLCKGHPSQPIYFPFPIKIRTSF